MKTTREKVQELLDEHAAIWERALPDEPPTVCDRLVAMIDGHIEGLRIAPIDQTIELIDALTELGRVVHIAAGPQYLDHQLWTRRVEPNSPPAYIAKSLAEAYPHGDFVIWTYTINRHLNHVNDPPTIAHIPIVRMAVIE